MTMPEQLPSHLSQNIRVLFTDVDDTLTYKGEIPFETIQAIHQLRAAGILVVPVTGASAGWCDCLLKTLPIKYIVGENGAFYMEQAEGGHTITHFLKAAERVEKDLAQLKALAQQLKTTFADIGFTQDQNFRISDVALDIGQAVKVEFSRAKQATEWLKSQGVNAKLSSIHINTWIGDYNKASGALAWIDAQQIPLAQCAFIGDSTNDEAMFEAMPLSVGVANVQRFLPTLSHKPDYITQQNGGLGFVELAKALLNKN